MTPKGFDKKTQSDPIVSAASILYNLSEYKRMPVVVPMYPKGNDQGLEPGQAKISSGELTPTCEGLVFAVCCSADDAQVLFDLVFRWETERKKREGDRNDLRLGFEEEWQQGGDR